MLTQRVVALNGVLDHSQSGTRQRTVTRIVEAQVSLPSPAPVQETEPVDLSITALEWGVQRPSKAPAKVAPPVVTDAEWATYSSLSIEVCEELLTSQRLLRSNIEEAVTQQYRPASVSSTDLASLDKVLAAAGEPETYESGLVTRVRQAPPIPSARDASAPRMLSVHAWIVWTVLGLLAACVLALAYLVVVYLL